MDTNPLNCRIIFSPYNSIRLNLLPKPGILTLSQSGIITLTDTSNHMVIVSKPLGEIARITPSQIRRPSKRSYRTSGLAMFVGRNEAYRIIFGSEDPVLNSGIDIYEKILNGDRAGAIEQFKANDITKANKSQIQAAQQQANEDCESFITAAKQAGIYRSPFSGVTVFVFVLIFVVVIGVLVYGFLNT